MNQEVGLLMLKVEEKAANDPYYQSLLAEYRPLDRQFQKALKTMTREQRDTVEDYCGVLGAMFRKMLELACEMSLC